MDCTAQRLLGSRGVRGLSDLGTSLGMGGGKWTCWCLPKHVGTQRLRRGTVHLSKGLSMLCPPSSMGDSQKWINTSKP